MAQQLVDITAVPRALPQNERTRLQRRARQLAWGGIGWHFIEFAIAIGAGIAAGSIALIGFGADSLIEAFAGLVVVWPFTGRRLHSKTAERRAQQVIAGSFFVLAAYVGAEAIHTLIDGSHPEASWVGIGLAAITAPTMPVLARAKQRVGNKLDSSATVKEGAQNMLCAYLSIALLVGLLANALANGGGLTPPPRWSSPLSPLGKDARAGVARVAATPARGERRAERHLGKRFPKPGPA